MSYRRIPDRDQNTDEPEPDARVTVQFPGLTNK